MKSSWLLALLVGANFTAAQNVLGQDDLDLEMMEMEDDTFSFDEIEVDGRAKKRPSISDKMKNMRDRMEQKTEDRVLKKIEDARIKEEIKLTKKLSNMFNGQAMGLEDEDRVDQVTQTSAATTSVVVESTTLSAPVEAAPTYKAVKITPHVGVTGMQTESFNNFESSYTTGLNVDSRVSEHFAIAVGFNFTKMTIQDYSNGQNPFYAGPNYSPYAYSSPYSSYSPYYGDYYNWYNSQFGAREIDFTGYGINIAGKFYIIGTGVIQPYVGAGMGYNRTKLAYDESSTSTYNGSYSPYNNTQFGNEGYSGSYISGEALIGTDIMFTDMLGLNVQFKFSKGLSSQSNDAQGVLANPDQLFLNQLGQEIDNSSQATISAGLNVAF